MLVEVFIKRSWMKFVELSDIKEFLLDISWL